MPSLFSQYVTALRHNGKAFLSIAELCKDAHRFAHFQERQWMPMQLGSSRLGFDGNDYVFN